jgi:hypothetical protein
LPTNWATAGAGTLATEIVGAGTEAGFSYLDIKFSGTTSTSALTVAYESQSLVAAASGQTWTGSHYVTLVGGSLTNITIVRTTVRGNTSGGSLLESDSTNFTPTSTATRFSHTRTLNDATTARVNTNIGITFSSGATIDITLRIAAPQLEQGAFPTSYIPTTTAAATRAADSAVVTPISSFYNQVEGTVVVEANVLSARPFHFDDNVSAENSVSVVPQVDVPRYRVVVGGSNQAAIDVGAAMSGATLLNIAAAYRADDFAVSRDGASVATDTSGSVPTGLTHLRIGRSFSAFWGNGHIRKLAYWPKRLSNTLLEQLTT